MIIANCRFNEAAGQPSSQQIGDEMQSCKEYMEIYVVAKQVLLRQSLRGNMGDSTDNDTIPPFLLTVVSSFL